MSRRQSVFVSSGISEKGFLINEVIPASSKEEAGLLYEKLFSQKPLEVLGPFYHKRIKEQPPDKKLKFSNVTKNAHYNGWVVKAFFLAEPKDYAYLIFIKRLDDNNIPCPKGTTTVPISQLRFI